MPIQNESRSLSIIISCLLVIFICGASLSEVKEHWSELSSVEKEELLQQKKSFDKLSPEKQQALRKLHHELSNHADAEALLEVAARYSDWLQTLPAGERAELLDLPAEQRIKKIQKVISEQEAKELQRLIQAKIKPEDVQAVLRWVENFLLRHESEIIVHLPEHVRSGFLKKSAVERKSALMGMYFMLRIRNKDVPEPTPADFGELIDSLSPAAKRAIQNLPDHQQRLQMIQGWIRASWHSRVIGQISNAELKKLFAQLPEHERRQLEELPQDEMFRQLRSRYIAEKYRRERFGRKQSDQWKGPRKSRPGNRPGNRDDLREHERDHHGGPPTDQPDRPLHERDGDQRELPRRRPPFSGDGPPPRPLD